MGDGERELLLAAQKEALGVLSRANTEAERIAREAEDDAVALVLEQQQRASSLLHQAQDAASKDAGPMENVSTILEAHRAAADLLGATEREVATRLSEMRANTAVDVLMAGHREASAILLAAWMQVTEGRHTDR